MRRLMFVVLGLGFIAGSLYAAKIGCMQYDDTGCSINGNIVNGLGTAVPSMKAATVATSSPTAAGQLIFCSDCVSGNSGRGMLCLSTATLTAQNSYVAVGTFTATTACQ